MGTTLDTEKVPMQHMRRVALLLVGLLTVSLWLPAAVAEEGVESLSLIHI